MAERLLTVEGLSTHFFTYAGVVKAVNGVSFTLDRKETLGIVGESGSGKTVAALSIMRLIPDPPGKVVDGVIDLGGRDLRQISADEMRQVRGNDIAMIFQDPMTSLNPVMKIGSQIAEAIILHQDKGKGEAWQLAAQLLDRVGIPDAEKRVNQYPFEFSGGMRQRVMIAMALIARPELLIADEPTTALDVTVQAQILDLLRRLQRERGMAVIFITHDLGVVAGLCDRVQVMYAGRIVEMAATTDVFASPQHPYTRALQRSIPALQPKGSELFTIPGLPPDLSRLPPGCAFAPRCEFAVDRCRTGESPTLDETKPRHRSACLRVQAGEI